MTAESPRELYFRLEQGSKHFVLKPVVTDSWPEAEVETLGNVLDEARKIFAETGVALIFIDLLQAGYSSALDIPANVARVLLGDNRNGFTEIGLLHPKHPQLDIDFVFNWEADLESIAIKLKNGIRKMAAPGLIWELTQLDFPPVEIKKVF